MAYEPVLAPAIVTGDSSVTVSGDSGFRHYLKSISASLTPTRSPITSKTISTAFIIPQSETVKDITHYSALEGFSSFKTSQINQPDSGTMATFAPPNNRNSDSDNVFHESGISSSILSSPFQSPCISQTNGEEVLHEFVRSPSERSSIYQKKTPINLHPQGGTQSITAFFNKLFRRRDTSSSRSRESSTSQIGSDSPLVDQSVISPAKETTTFKVTYHSGDWVTKLRSIEVFSDLQIGTHRGTELVTVTRYPKSSKSVLRTACIQAEFTETCPKPVPPYAQNQRPIFMSIGKGETTKLPSTPNRFETIDKCTSPLTIPLAFNGSPTRSNTLAMEKKQQPPEAAYWYRDDQDSTWLSTQIDLESDTSLQQSDESLNMESEGLYEPVIKKSTYPQCHNTDIQGSTPVCRTKFNSETDSKLSAHSSMEGSDFTVTQNPRDGRNVRQQKRDNDCKWLSVGKKTSSKLHIQSPPSPRHNLRNQNDTLEEGTPTEDSKVISRNPNRQSRKLKAKSPPSIILRRNRDIVNGVQIPVSPMPGSFRLKRIFSIPESRTPSTNPRNADRKFSQSTISDYHQNSIDETYSPLHSNSMDSPEGRIPPISDNDTSGIVDIGLSLSTQMLGNTDLESPQKFDKDSILTNGSQTSLEFQKSVQVGESNSSDSSGISLHFTSPSSVNTSVDITTAPSQISQEDEQPKERKISSAKVEIGLILPQPLEIVETSHQTNIKSSNYNCHLVIKEESEQERCKNARSSLISDLSIDNKTTKPASQVTPRPKLEVDLNKTPVPIRRPQNLALETNFAKVTILSSPTSSEVPKVTSSLSKLSPLPMVDPLPSVNACDKNPPPQKCAKSPRPWHIPDPDKTQICKKSTPTSPVNQIFFPKSMKQPPHSPSDIAANSIEITENNKVESVVTVNSGIKESANVQENKTMNTVRSTKLTRGTHVTKRPQTVSMTVYDDNVREISIAHPETYKNVKPDCHFVMHEKVGKGKFGSVFRCESKQTHQTLAMKEIKTNGLARHTSGDIMEVAVLRAIGHHENIACLHSAYEFLRTCFIVTEYVSGGALFDRVESENDLDEPISASIVRQMLLGLQHIQACSILHLDLKPENIMMVAPTGYQLKIIDFGLAYFYDPKRPKRQMAGTFIYSAPETINYEMQSFETDTWSVAVIAYELLSGITPFQCPPPETPDKELTMPEVTTNIIKCQYNFDDYGICDASEKAKDFIRMILKKNPKDRPSIKECLEHPWITMANELPKVRRVVSIRRHASNLERTRSPRIGQRRITMDERF